MKQASLWKRRVATLAVALIAILAEFILSHVNYRFQLAFNILLIAALFAWWVVDTRRHRAWPHDASFRGAVGVLLAASMWFVLFESESAPPRVIAILLFLCVPIVDYDWIASLFGRLYDRTKTFKSAFSRSPLFAGCVAFGFALALFVLVWMRNYPYHDSPDARLQWMQIHGQLPLSDIHPVAHTLFMKLILRLYDNYAAVILVQILLLCLMYGLFARYAAQKGAPVELILVMLALFMLPMNVRLAYVAPWKDLPYTFCVGMVTLLACRWVDAPESFGNRSLWRAPLLGAFLAASYLMRKNGVVVLIGMGVYFLVAFARRRMFRQIVLMALAGAVLIGGVNFYGYRVLGAQSPANGYAYQVFGSGLAAIANDKNVTQEELDEIDALVPVDWLQSQYTPGNGSMLIWERDEAYNSWPPEQKVFNNTFVMKLGEHPGEVIRLYFKLLPRHLAACISDVLHNTRTIWAVSTLTFLVLPDHILLLVLLLLAARGVRTAGAKKIGFAVFMPVLLSALSIAVSSITNEPRYLLPTFKLMPALMLFILTRPRREDVEAAS